MTAHVDQTGSPHEIKRMDIREFREEGYLQEVNRLFLHPLGLALEVIVEEDGAERLGGVWDYRSDPEGILFEGPPEELTPKAHRIALLWRNRTRDRLRAIGYMVQPAPGGRAWPTDTANEQRAI